MVALVLCQDCSEATQMPTKVRKLFQLISFCLTKGQI